MATIKLFTYNILEDNAVTVTGTPDTGYPEERLYDRSIGFYWKLTASGDVVFHIDQGGGYSPIDLLAIEKHNFSGRVMHWEYSSNDADWYAAVTSWTQGDNLQIIKALDSSLSYRYWRVRVISAVNPMCSEIFMSLGYPFRYRMDEAPDDIDLDNVAWEDSVGGVETANKMGDVRSILTYSIFLDEVENGLTDWTTAMSFLDGFSKPFYISDHLGNYLYVRLNEMSKLEYLTKTSGVRDVTFKEMLG